MDAPRVLSIFHSPCTGAPLTSVTQVKAIAGVGLEGDRYASGKGFYSGVKEWDAHVTLITREPFDLLKVEHNVELNPAELRRNLLVERVDLASLVGRKFKIGESAVFYGRKLWPPCAHIVKTTGRIEIFKHLAKECGIGADILIGGEISIGDQILLVEA